MIKEFKKIAKKFILTLSGKISHLKKAVNCRQAWYGNEYGGFYICPDFLNSNSIVYSFGIGEDISFDKAVIINHNCEVFGFDPTPKSINWVKEQNTNGKFKFFDFGISSKSGFVDFYLPKNPSHVSGSMISQNNINDKEKVVVKMKTILDIMEQLGHTHIDVLKMDIEGGEYGVIENILDNNISVTQILIEFHDRFFKDGKQKSYETVMKLQSSGYEIFAVSDSYEEISFINKNSI